MTGRNDWGRWGQQSSLIGPVGANCAAVCAAHGSRTADTAVPRAQKESARTGAYQGALACVVTRLQVRPALHEQLHGFLPPKLRGEVQRSAACVVLGVDIRPAGEQSTQVRDVTFSNNTVRH